MKKRKRTPEDLLDFLVASVPPAEPPPYFAPRVAALAGDQASDFILVMNRFARWLLPTFAVLGVVVLMLSYQLTVSPARTAYPEFLFEEEATEQTVTTEFVLDSLQPQYQVD